MRWFVHLEQPPGHLKHTPCHLKHTPGHLLTLPEVPKLQEMMGTAPGHIFWVKFSDLCSSCHGHSRGCPEPAGGMVMLLAVSLPLVSRVFPVDLCLLVLVWALLR